MLTGIVIFALAFAAGYLARRWHRPTGWQPSTLTDTFREGEWRLLCSGPRGESISLRCKHPITPLGVAEIIKAMKSGAYVATPELSADALRQRSGRDAA